MNDTLGINVTFTSAAAGDYSTDFFVSDTPSRFIKEVNRTFVAGQNLVNVSFDARVMQGGSFNYTVRVYNLSNVLVYRSDPIPTSNYTYQKLFTILTVSDYAQGMDGIRVNISVNASVSIRKNISVSLVYNDSLISKTTEADLANVTTVSVFFDNETVKSSHWVGTYNLTRIVVGDAVRDYNITTQSYDYGSFAKTSYIQKVEAYPQDLNSDNISEKLLINVTLNIKTSDSYNLSFVIIDSSGNVFKQLNQQNTLSVGNQNLVIEINGSEIYALQPEGPYSIQEMTLTAGGQVLDYLALPAVTNTTSFSDFAPPERANLKINISVTYNSSQPNVANYTLLVTNEGNVSAFGFVVDVEGNDTYNYTFYIPFLAGNNNSIIQQNRENDTMQGRYVAFVDLTNNVDEYNKTDNIASNIRTTVNISNLSALSTNGTQVIYEAIIKNTGDTTLDNVTWRFEYGDNTNDSSITNATLLAGQSAYVFLAHDYAQAGSYSVLVVAQSNGRNNSAAIVKSVGEGLVISNLSVLDTRLFNATFEMIITNPTDQNKSGNTWSLNTGDAIIDSSIAYNLSNGSSIMVFIEHNYSRFGRFNPVATVNTDEDTETALARISEFIITNLTSLVESGLNRTFEILVQNIWNTQSSGNWSINTGADTYTSNQQFTLNQSKNISIYIEHTYASSQNRTITAFVNTNQSNDTLTINI
ncbi:MAG: hypothetical protein AABX47_05005 [Nanoarchaeota archaeon]